MPRLRIVRSHHEEKAQKGPPNFDHLKYDSFGNITAQSHSAYQPLVDYTGQIWDSGAGLCYDHARWYDPKTGRFISQDPTSFAAGDVNLYRYVGNGPTNATDPTGLRLTPLTNGAGVDAPLNMSGWDSDLVPFMLGMGGAGDSGGGGSWLDEYSNGFNSMFGSGWSNWAGGMIHGITGNGIGSMGDLSLLAWTVGFSVPAGVVIFFGAPMVPPALAALAVPEVFMPVGGLGLMAGMGGCTMSKLEGELGKPPTAAPGQSAVEGKVTFPTENDRFKFYGSVELNKPLDKPGTLEGQVGGGIIIELHPPKKPPEE